MIHEAPHPHPVIPTAAFLPPRRSVLRRSGIGGRRSERGSNRSNLIRGTNAIDDIRNPCAASIHAGVENTAAILIPPHTNDSLMM
jgi:hypothetical protein